MCGDGSVVSHCLVCGNFVVGGGCVVVVAVGGDFVVLVDGGHGCGLVVADGDCGVVSFLLLVLMILLLVWVGVVADCVVFGGVLAAGLVLVAVGGGCDDGVRNCVWLDHWEQEWHELR